MHTSPRAHCFIFHHVIGMTASRGVHVPHKCSTTLAPSSSVRPSSSSSMTPARQSPNRLAHAVMQLSEQRGFPLSPRLTISRCRSVGPNGRSCAWGACLATVDRSLRSSNHSTLVVRGIPSCGVLGHRRRENAVTTHQTHTTTFSASRRK